MNERIPTATGWVLGMCMLCLALGLFISRVMPPNFVFDMAYGSFLIGGICVKIWR